MMKKACREYIGIPTKQFSASWRLHHKGCVIMEVQRLILRTSRKLQRAAWEGFRVQGLYRFCVWVMQRLVLATSARDGRTCSSSKYTITGRGII